ncbi:hypothetical protein C1H46_014388 [Malus baccata]|uniref:Uncharacterized protein n=1 Tax=Malus baccata TaxID=106549 RepID=A0A540MNP5_MALBA|nr:hypothetical protein C1H46_014388 [Malus baccata]
MRFVQRGLGGGQAPESSEAIEAKKMKMKKKKMKKKKKKSSFSTTCCTFFWHRKTVPFTHVAYAYWVVHGCFVFMYIENDCVVQCSKNGNKVVVQYIIGIRGNVAKGCPKMKQHEEYARAEVLSLQRKIATRAKALYFIETGERISVDITSMIESAKDTMSPDGTNFPKWLLSHGKGCPLSAGLAPQG